MEQTFFEKKLKPILLYMGTIVSVIMALAYILVVFVLIEGFKAESLINTTIFSVITAAIGFCIMQMLKIQGQDFAKNLPQNKEITKRYSERNIINGKKRKFKSMKCYWTTSVIKDIVVKCATLALTSIGMIYIMIEGSGDYSLLFLAAVNLLMFAGFGLISLCKAYDFYNEEYVPYMLNEIEEAKNEAERKIEEAVEMAQKRAPEQRDDSVCGGRGGNILDASMDTCFASVNNGEPLLLDGSNRCDTVLGSLDNTRNTTSNSTYSSVEETSSKN